MPSLASSTLMASCSLWVVMSQMSIQNKVPFSVVLLCTFTEQILAKSSLIIQFRLALWVPLVVLIVSMIRSTSGKSSAVWTIPTKLMVLLARQSFSSRHQKKQNAWRPLTVNIFTLVISLRSLMCRFTGVSIHKAG
jgi:TRAP-type uncharacterized transport system fused permease subunit